MVADFGSMMLNIATTYFNFLMSNFLGGIFLFFIVLNFIAVIIHFGGKNK